MIILINDLCLFIFRYFWNDLGLRLDNIVYINILEMIAKYI